MQMRRAPAAAGGDAFGEHLHHRLEVVAAEVAERVGAVHQLPYLVLGHLLAGDHGDDLLGQDVERVLSDLDAIELAGADGAHRGGALHQVVARQREEDALRHRAEPVARAADALQQRREGARRAEVADEVDVPDVDAELQRRGGHDDRDRAALQSFFGLQADAPRQAAVVRGDLVLAEPLSELMRDALDQAARVDEDDRRAVRLRVRDDAIVDVGVQLVRGDRAELVTRDFDAEIERALVADVDDGAIRRTVDDDALRPDEQARDVLDRLLRRAQPDALQAAAGEAIEPFERQCQMRAAFVAGDGVDLVDDHRVRLFEHLPAALGGEQDVERLGRRDEDVRRPAHHRLPLVCRRIAGAHEDANLRQRHATLRGELLNLGQRLLQVLLNVVGERLQRRDVDDAGAIVELTGGGTLNEAVDRPEKRGQRFT